MYCYNCMQKLEDGTSICPNCGKKTNIENIPHHLAPGTVLNGKFLVGNSIGEGGFGITYVGLNTKLDLKIAIKEFYPNGYANRNNTVSNEVTLNYSRNGEYFKQGLDKFLYEAKSIAKFSDEKCIVNVSDFFEENNTAYIIMEYLDGITLSERVKQGAMTSEETVRMMLPLLKSLDKMHSQKILHRDISPDNIMLLKDGTLKLMDFGSARYFSDSGSKTMSVMLKPGYAPYEQYYSKGNQGTWTDVYGICATMYKCVTGIAPPDSLERISSDSLKKPSELGVSIPENIENAIMSGLEIYPQNRCRSISELIKQLSDIATKQNITVQVIENTPQEPLDNTDDDKYKTIFADGSSDFDDYSDGFTRAGAEAEDEPEKAEDKEPENKYKTTFTDDKPSSLEKNNSDGNKDKKKHNNDTKIGCIGIILIIAAIVGLIFLFNYMFNYKNYTFDEKTGTLTFSGDVTRDDVFDNGLADIKHIIIEDGVKTIDDFAFRACNYAESIKIPDSVTSIGEGAFAGCYEVEEIHIPDGLEVINDSTFCSCKNLNNVVIPDSVTSIGKSAFENCDSLTSVTIPDSVTHIGDYAFGYNADELVEGFIIFGKKGSTAETYATKNGIEFVPE